MFGPGYAHPVATNVIDYITFATIGNATDFGDPSTLRAGTSGMCSPTRGCFSGGFGPSPAYTQSNVIDYITIASTGNATDFGDATVTRDSPTGTSSATRGVTGGGNASPANTNVIDYITIASTGNATDFGDLTSARNKLQSGSNKTRAVFAGGQTPSIVNTIDYITI